MSRVRIEVLFLVPSSSAFSLNEQKKMSGLDLFKRGEIFYSQGKIQEAFDSYQKSIKKILKDEIVTAKLPAIIPDDFPKEILGAVWRNFVGFFRDPNMSFTKTS